MPSCVVPHSPLVDRARHYLTLPSPLHRFPSLPFTFNSRDGAMIETWEVEYYNFDYQDAILAPTDHPWSIKPGDSFEVQCIYKTDSNTVKMGTSSQEEMCIAFVTVMGDYKTKNCVYMYPNVMEYSPTIINLLQCKNHKAFPFDTENNDMLCAFLATIDPTDPCLSQPGAIAPSIIMNYLECDTSDSAMANYVLDESELEFCSQRQEVVKSVGSQLLLGARSFGSTSASQCAETCPSGSIKVLSQQCTTGAPTISPTAAVTRPPTAAPTTEDDLLGDEEGGSNPRYGSSLVGVALILAISVVSSWVAF
jgi:hypothetical protein